MLEREEERAIFGADIGTSVAAGRHLDAHDRARRLYGAPAANGEFRDIVG